MLIDIFHASYRVDSDWDWEIAWTNTFPSAGPHQSLPPESKDILIKGADNEIFKVIIRIAV